MSDMDIQRLRTFRSVVATGSVRAAAQALDYSPASVSQQVSQLQHDTGLILLSRVGRGVEPTTAGLALADRIDSLLLEVGELDDFIAALREGRGGVFVLCYFSSLGAAWIPSVLAQLTAEFPEVRIDLRVRDEYVAGMLPRPTIQLVAEATHLGPPEGFRADPITTDPYQVLLPRSHRLAGSRAPIRLADLAQDQWIDTNAGLGSCRQIVVDACAAAGFRPAFHIQAQDYGTAIALVARGLGIAVVPRIAAKAAPTTVRAKPLTDPTPRRQITALVSANDRQLPICDRAIELLHRAATD